MSIYYKFSLFNADTMILIFHSFKNVNKLCLNQCQNIQLPGIERVNPHPTHPQAPINLLNSHQHGDHPLSRDCFKFGPGNICVLPGCRFCLCRDYAYAFLSRKPDWVAFLQRAGISVLWTALCLTLAAVKAIGLLPCWTMPQAESV